MKTKVIQAILLASILTWVWGWAAWAADWSRKKAQQRIQGQTGSVKRGGREQRRFDRAYNRAASDGYLNRYERKRLHNMQDRASHHIYRAKHNNVNRLPHPGHYNWGRHAKRYDGHMGRHHYWDFRKRHPRPVVYSYQVPYPAQSYPRVGYALSGSINEPGRTLAFSTGGYW